MGSGFPEGGGGDRGSRQVLDDFRTAYRSTHSLLGGWTGKAAGTISAGAIGVRLSTAYGSVRRRLTPAAIFNAIAKRPWIGLLAIAILAAAYETQSSHFEARYFVDLDHRITAPLKPGPSRSILFPEDGPYDQRLGYAALPRFVSDLVADGYAVREQAHWSGGLEHFVRRGGFAIYNEKDQGGLDIVDQKGKSLYRARFPQFAYPDFASIPPLIVHSLLFTEDRYLLDSSHPQRNGAVEWKRFAWAALGRVVRVVSPHFKAGGGSTLATQIEKFRHSHNGVTEGIADKLRQVTSASARLYLGGPDTLARRRQVVTTYLNSTPLASAPGYGEVIGLPDALWAWFGVSNNDATRILTSVPHDPAGLALKGEVYREALSLILSARRPDFYLIQNRDRLEVLIDRYLRILFRAGVIDAQLRDAALNARLHFHYQPPTSGITAFSTDRAVESVRNNLVSLLQLPNLYSLDRLDLKVDTTTDTATQTRISSFLERLSDPDFLKSQGMVGHQLLGDADPAKVTYSFVLYERRGERNLLRVRADSLNKPFDINSGAKLMMGSTAKLRTLATYLEIMRELNEKFATRSRRELLGIAAAAQDPLTFWAADYLSRTHDRGLQPMFDAAMQRHYSGAPGAFFTGSGRQGFGNFDKSENRQNPTISLAFQHSINLSFVRLLRDIVTFYEVQAVPNRARLLNDPSDPARRAYLRTFADEEGKNFLRRFYKQLSGQPRDQMMAMLARQARPAAGPLAALYLGVHPNAPFAELKAFLLAHLPRARVTDEEVYRVLATDSPARLSWQDLGYVSGVHPLELWLARYRIAHPAASWKEVARASADIRQQVYKWLFRGSLHKQDTRIRILLERAAFDRILEHWRSLGYPFEHLVPSLGTAVGASGDSPDALAKLMGIILNGGVELPTESLTQLRFGANTPYDTILTRKTEPVRVMAPEIARTLTGVMTGVVSDGTASRLRGAYLKTDGSPLAVGGKTGTGDNRADRFSRGGGMIESRSIDRTATFVFFLGDRFFGTVTAYVPGPYASRYHFSSALAVQLLKALQPDLQPLLGTAKFTASTLAPAPKDDAGSGD